MRATIHGISLSVAVGVAFALINGPVFAQGVDISLTPRIQYLMINVNGLDEEGVGTSTERLEMPFAGLTVGVNPLGLKNIDFQISAYYGQDDVKSIDSTPADTSNTDVERLDIEVLARYAIPETAVTVYGGARMIKAWEDTVGTGGANLGFNFAASGATTQEIIQTWYFAELGAAFAASVTNSGKHRVFGGVTGLIGYEDFEVDNRTVADVAPLDDQGFAWGADMQIGYQFIFNGVSAHLRYRTLLLSDQRGGEEHLLIAHGPEIGVTFKF